MTDTPYFTIATDKVIDQYEYMQRFADTVNYSAKTNYDIIPVLEERTDAGFSVHFDHALGYIDDYQRVTFFLQGTSRDELTSLYEAGITTFVVDNEPDLALIEQWIEDANPSITLYLRMQRREHTVQTGKHYVFGLSSTTVNEAIQRLADHNADLGVHVHRKTQNVAEWRLSDELDNALNDTTLNTIDALNAGGGFPVQYKNYQRNTLSSIKQRFDDLKTWASTHDIDVIIEPGRIIAGPPGKLHATIINVYDDTVVLDTSVFNAAMDTFATNTRLEIVGENEDGDGHAYTVKGRTPDSLDIFRYKAWLDDPERGDTLTFKNATAYNYASDFCDLQQPLTELTR